jgi:RNA polymerase sigma-70 factor (ECF subfamily)
VSFDDPDIYLITSFQAGDERAFDILYERHHRSVLNVAYRFLGDRDSAEDVAQDVFVKLYQSPKTYRPTAGFTTWLYRVTYNACIDQMRKRKRSNSVALEDSSERVVDPAALPETQAESNELAREVRSAIASLPENQRIAVVLQMYEGLLYQQIADVMRTSVSAIESLLFRAKQTLKERLSSYVEDEQRPVPAAEIPAEKKTQLHRKFSR